MSRKSIMVAPDVKDRIQALKDSLGLANESAVLDYLLSIGEEFDFLELKAFMDLRTRIESSFKRQYKIKE